MPTDDDGPSFDRAAILTRRTRFVTAAIAGLTTGTMVTACPCLKVAQPSPGSDGGDGSSSSQGQGSQGSDTETSTGASSGTTAAGADPPRPAPDDLTPQ